MARAVLLALIGWSAAGWLFRYVMNKAQETNSFALKILWLVLCGLAGLIALGVLTGPL